MRVDGASSPGVYEADAHVLSHLLDGHELAGDGGHHHASSISFPATTKCSRISAVLRFVVLLWSQC